MKWITKIWLAFVLGCLIGALASYASGFAMGIKWTITMGYNFLQESGVNISLTAEQIVDLVQAYKEHFEMTRGGMSIKGEAIVQGYG